MIEILPGHYIAGFVDGEGCFALKFRRDVRRDRKESPTYFYWDIEFIITLREDDKELLDKIAETLNCGKLSFSRNSVRLAVNDTDDLTSKVIPFFEKYPLRGKKRHDFELWKEALSIFRKNLKVRRKKYTSVTPEGKKYKTNWNPDDLERLKIIHQRMRPFKSVQKPWKWL